MKRKIIAMMTTFSLLMTMMMSFVYATGLTISKEEVTIEKGKTTTLTLTYNNQSVEAEKWESSDSSVATVSNGVVTGKLRGSATIKATYNNTTVSCRVSVIVPTARYTVLILDTSGSIKGTPLTKEKAAAKAFVNTLLKADGNNYVAVVALNTTSKKVLGFSNNKTKLYNAITKLKAKGSTNMNNAFVTANKLLANVKVKENITKNIVICSDGLPQTGTKTTKGRYKKSQHKDYAFANATYNTDVKSKAAGYFVYSLGFFHNSKGKDLTFGKKLMKDLASKDKYYSITKTSDVKKALNKIATKITVTKPRTVTLSESSITVYVGQTKTLKAYVNGKVKSASWSTANKKIATVSKGKVKGIKVGNTTITATIDGVKVKCKVKVIKKPKTISGTYITFKTSPVKVTYKTAGSENWIFKTATVNEYTLKYTLKDGKISKGGLYYHKVDDTKYEYLLAFKGTSGKTLTNEWQLSYNGNVKFNNSYRDYAHADGLFSEHYTNGKLTGVYSSWKSYSDISLYYYTDKNHVTYGKYTLKSVAHSSNIKVFNNKEDLIAYIEK